MIAVRPVDEEVADQIPPGGIFHIKRGPLPVRLPGHGYPMVVVRMCLARDPLAPEVKDPDSADVGVVLYDLTDRIHVTQFRTLLQELWIQKPELEEVAAVGGGQVGIFPALTGREIGDDPVG